MLPVERINAKGACHGRDGTGRHGGAFPKELVESFVTGNRDPLVPAHGSKDMPVWGPIFLALDPNPTANRVRIETTVTCFSTGRCGHLV